MKLALVIHRYGADFAGGSETHCRHLAERLTANHDVTVLTTCARDYVTWANAYPPGASAVNGVCVHRFPVARTRDLKAFAQISDEVFDGPSDPERQEEWFRANGPDAPALLDHLRDEGAQYDLVLFWAFRYAGTFFGLPLVQDRAVLIPTAENDPAIWLDVVEEYFRRPAAYLFLTPEEQALVSRRAARPLAPAAVIGAGLEPVGPPPDRAVLDALGLPRDFVLYLGRIDRNKGCETLFEYFIEHLAEDRADTMLLLAGPATIPVPDHPRIRALGFVDDAVRDALLAHARAMVVPSPYESLNIALLEGWNHGVPALVNADCAVLDGQVRRAHGGLAYRSAKEFSAGLTWLLTHADRARAVGAQGRTYVEQEYRWPTVMTRVEELLAAAAHKTNARAGRGLDAITEVNRAERAATQRPPT